MADPLEVKENNKQALLKLPNVVGTSVGRKYVNGLPTDEPAILVFVETKMTPDGVISKYSAEQMIPTSLDSIPTDVIEVGKIVKQAQTTRVRPLIPGYSCGHGSITAGTIGGFFRDKDGDIVVLSNNHILAWENAAKIGDPIFQPGPTDASQPCQFSGWIDPVSNLPYFGTLKNFITIKDRGNVQDSAIAKVHDKLVNLGMVSPTYPIVGRKAAGWGAANIGDNVQKCGRTTSHTTGSVIGLHGTFTIEYDFGPAEFNDCIVTTFMSRGGDSGSVIYDLNMNAVGLLFAGSDRVTIANPIGAVKNHYGLEIWDGNATPPVAGWNLFPRHGKITLQDTVFSIEAAANDACYAERSIDTFNTIECVVNTGSDRGATWAPGLAVIWPNGSLKVNLRRGGRFGGYYNNDYNINLGNVKPDTDYTLRIRRLYNNSQTIVGEVQDGQQWVTVMAVPASVFQPKPTCIRVGKTDQRGRPTDNAPDNVPSGQVGTCTIKNIKIT